MANAKAHSEEITEFCSHQLIKNSVNVCSTFSMAKVCTYVVSRKFFQKSEFSFFHTVKTTLDQDSFCYKYLSVTRQS